MSGNDHPGDELRIGTAEREAAIKILSDHMSEGRLSFEEYEERMSTALESRTKGDLRVLFTDLPAPYPPFLAPPVPAMPPPPPIPHLPPPSGLPAYFQSAPPPALAGQSDRYRVVSGVLQIMFPFGIGRFYSGHNGIAVAQLVTAFIGVGVIWSMIDGIIILASGGRDAFGRELRM